MCDRPTETMTPYLNTTSLNADLDPGRSVVRSLQVITCVVNMTSSTSTAAVDRNFVSTLTNTGDLAVAVYLIVIGE